MYEKETQFVVHSMRVMVFLPGGTIIRILEIINNIFHSLSQFTENVLMPLGELRKKAKYVFFSLYEFFFYFDEVFRCLIFA